MEFHEINQHIIKSQKLYIFQPWHVLNRWHSVGKIVHDRAAMVESYWNNLYLVNATSI